MDTRVPLRRLETFCLVVDEGGVTRAAKRLMIAQPAVSAQVASLEKTLGAELFVRAGSRLVLTEAGQRVYHWAKEVLAGSVQVQRDVDELAAGTAGSVVVAASMAIGTYLLPPIMTGLRRRRPGAEITVHINEPAVALRSAQLGEVDFAVTSWLDEDVPEALSAEKLWEEPLILCASPDGPPDGDEVRVRDLAALPFVGVPTTVAFHRLLQVQLHSHGIADLPVTIRLGHAEAIKQAVADNGWVCFAPWYAVARDLAEGRLRQVRLADAAFHEGIGLYHRTAKYFSPLQTAALDALREAAARHTA
ncbi:LysR family transcriptional regulator [Amycolatopsis thermoflava]|uniref:LysR family transcriptional regulator n=1 Tax=Amycolatopsis thermoflava TaxID=84480 RepID=UPI0038007EB3